MSVYEAEKIYPDISTPSAPLDDVESNTFRLKNISEIENFLAREIIERDRLCKKFKRYTQALNYVDQGLLAGTIICTGGDLTTILTGIGTPAAIAFGSLGLLSAILQGILNKTALVYLQKAQKHHDIRLAAQTVLDGISINISKAIEGSHIDHLEYQKIVQEKQCYLAIKNQIRTKVKKMIKNITQEQREEILKQGRQEGREDFLKQITNSSDIRHVNAI